MAVQIVEILGRAKQGVTFPFKCIGDDGQFYYVKGMGSHAGRSSLLAEWIAGHLAQEFGLPIPPFSVVDIPEALIDAAPLEWATLGAGAAFGSQVLPFAQELQWSQLAKVPKDTQRDVLVFDWWVHNEDRHLTEQGGNPNLLWDTQHQRLAVIDHNQAFDRTFNSTDFVESHVFRAQRATVFDDLVMRATYQQRLEQAFAAFDVACHTCPSAWWWVDHDVPSSFDRDAARQLLARFSDQSFWGIA